MSLHVHKSGYLGEWISDAELVSVSPLQCVIIQWKCVSQLLSLA